MSATILADYLPEPKESYANARSLAYRIEFSSKMLRDTAIFATFCAFGFLVAALFLDLKFSAAGLVRGSRALYLLTLLWVAVLAWQLFRIWSAAPGFGEPEPMRCKLSSDGENLIIESGPNRFVSPFGQLGMFLDHAKYVAFQLSQTSSALIFPNRAFVENGREELLAILSSHAERASWWTLGRMAGI